MATILSEDDLMVPADETPAYSSWAVIDSATSVSASVTVMNNQSADLWIQWTDDTDGPEPEDVDVFAVGRDPVSNGRNYYVHAHNLEPAGAYVRVKGVAYGTEAGPCHVKIDAS